MPYNETYLLVATSRTPWNKGKLIGAKPRLRPKHVWAIRTKGVYSVSGVLVESGSVIDVRVTPDATKLCSSETTRSATDRDRGEPRGSAPPTPPYVRVRIRRFEKLS